MSEFSKISWTDSTFNPWIGCTKVSPGCANCYAEEMDRKRFSKTLPGCSLEAPKTHWGKGAPRYRTKTWGEPVKWDQYWAVFQQVDMQDGTRHRGDMKQIAALALDADKIVACGPVRRRVFCSSLADWLDDEVPAEWLADLLEVVCSTPSLDWLLLTKRPGGWHLRMEAAQKVLEGRTSAPASRAFIDVDYWLHGSAPANVWIGTTVENQDYAERRIPELLKIPAKVRFLSVEPMLGPVDLSKILVNHKLAWFVNNHRGGLLASAMSNTMGSMPWIDWVICGGESGTGRRPFEIEWAESLAAQCATAGVAFFMKQDAHAKSGQQGRLPAALWSIKQFPVSRTKTHA